MRTWSIKTVVVTLSLTVILAAAAPRAEARSSQPTRAYNGATAKFQRAVNQLLKRFFGITTDGGPEQGILPTDPVPCVDCPPPDDPPRFVTDTDTETPTTPVPTQQQ